MENFYKDSNDDLDNHSDQLNPNNDAYWESRGYDGKPDNWEDIINNQQEYQYSKDDLDNHSNQLNSSSDEYWQSRGYDEKPENWEDLLDDNDMYNDTIDPDEDPGGFCFGEDD